MHLHKAFRAEFVTSLLIAAFGACAAISEPANGDRGVRYCIASSYPACGVSEPARDSGLYGEPVFGASGHRTVSNLSQMSSSSSDTSGCR